MTEESPGLVGEAVAIGMEMEEDDDNMLQQLQLKRRWETRYILKVFYVHYVRNVLIKTYIYNLYCKLM